jgi:hypothetical protein
MNETHGDPTAYRPGEREPGADDKASAMPPTPIAAPPAAITELAALGEAGATRPYVAPDARTGTTAHARTTTAADAGATAAAPAAATHAGAAATTTTTHAGAATAATTTHAGAAATATTAADAGAATAATTTAASLRCRRRRSCERNCHDCDAT